MDRQDKGNNDKFKEPRSWAAKWCGDGLTDNPRPNGRVEPEPRGAKEFKEPRGWSAKWSGGGLLEGPKR